MWADAGFDTLMGHTTARAAARMNPLRWSGRKSIEATISELEQRRAHSRGRPVRLRILECDHSYTEQVREISCNIPTVGYEKECATVEDALARLRHLHGLRRPTSLIRAGDFFMIRPGSLRSDLRDVCPAGAGCRERSLNHLESYAHPADPDYLDCCREADAVPEFVSIRRLFQWCDPCRAGRVGREELAIAWPMVRRLGKDIGDLDDDLWHKLDADGNGRVNFSEFADFCTESGIDLPLGLDDLLVNYDDESDASHCTVLGCRCVKFTLGRCGHTLEDPAKEDDSVNVSPTSTSYSQACCCGHGRDLHSSASTCSRAATFEYPQCWTSEAKVDGTCNKFVPVESALFGKFQALLDATYSDVTTRDRAKNAGGSWEVPRCFILASALRNEHSRSWRRYTIRKAELQKERSLAQQNPKAAAELPEFRVYDDVWTTRAWSSLSDADKLNPEVNEWYLFHGTTAACAREICQADFKFNLAGRGTGALYGPGCYFAESITKADEYTKEEEDGSRTVLLCRALGGRVRYRDERRPNASQLTSDCVEGRYDCIIGDRQKRVGTYREFVFFDTENIYPEYVLRYHRGELFRSSSYPKNPKIQ